MELIVDTVLLILSVFLLVISFFNIKKYDKLEEKQTIDSKHIETLYKRVNDLTFLEERIINLEQWNEDKNKHIFSLEQKLIATDLSLSDLVVNTQNKTKQLEERIIELEKTSKEFDCFAKDTIRYTAKLERRIIALEQQKQSEIRANYNMDFTHINTDI